MPDPDELATQHAEYLEDRSRQAADTLEERFEEARQRARREAEARIVRMNDALNQATLTHPTAVNDEGRAAADLIGGAELADSPWECPSKRADGHPDRCGLYDNPPTCSAGNCTVEEEEILDA